MPDLKDKTISGTVCSVTVDESGFFRITVRATSSPVGSANTLDAAIAKARPRLAQRKVKVKVEFFTMTGESGVATGLHSASGNILASIGGKSKQLTGFRETKVFQGTTPPEVLARYTELSGQASAIAREQLATERKWVVDLEPIVVTAIQRAQQVAGHIH